MGRTPAPLPRHPNGRIRWKAPEMHNRVITLMRRGWTVRRIAAHFGASTDSVVDAVARLGLNLPPKGEVLLLDLAADLNISITGMHAAVHRAGITPGRWGGRRTVMEAEAQMLRATRPAPARIVTAPPHGYVSTQTLARRWKVCPATVRARLRDGGVEASYWQRQTKGTVPLYDARAADRCAPAIALLREKPAGHLDVQEVMALTGLSVSGVGLWAKQGVPHARGFGNSQKLYFPAERLAVWLEGRPQERTRRKARAIRRHLAEQTGRVA